ncbi:hypothetical protein EDB86DRAFT_3088322 [Lactarius hatsudake]|nr:hypothetical protein EDB86DRAFT_3088322 [Lactarius hatsudake]
MAPFWLPTQHAFADRPSGCHLDWDPQLRFGFSLIAIVPLAKQLQCDAAEQMSLFLGQTPRALLGAAFSNAVELIVGRVALFHGQVRIVQTIAVSLMWIAWMTPSTYSSTVDSPELMVSYYAALFFLTQYIAYLVFQVLTTLFIARHTSWSSTESCPDEPFQDRKNTPEMSAIATSLALSIVTVFIFLAANSCE